MFLPHIHHHRFSTGNILKSTSQTCSPMASFYSTFRQISLLPSNPITVSYRLTTIKITFWRKWSISIPRASWQSLIRIAFRSTWFSLLHLLRIRRLERTYSTQSHEDRYWKEAAGGQRDLQRSDARFVGAGVRNPTNPAPHVPPLVMYYTPALLPEYRDSQRRKGKEARSKSPRPRKDEKQAKKPQRKSKLNKRSTNNTTTRMGSDSEHPTISGAARLRKLHSPVELRIIDHISQSLTDREVFDDPKEKPLRKASEYQKRWYDWRASEACIEACIEYNCP